MNTSSLITSVLSVVASLLPSLPATYAATPVAPPTPGRYATNGKVTVWVREGDPVPFFLRDTAPPRPALPVPAALRTERAYLAIAGKHPVRVSSLPKAGIAASVASPSCRDYVVITGKRSVLASSLTPAGSSYDPMRFCCLSNRTCHMNPACCPKP